VVAGALRDGSSVGVSLVRRLDHVAIVVRSTADALRFYEGHLGLRVASTELLEKPAVRLTYIDAGNAYLQLVEPLDGASAVASFLDEQGEGLHHICFGVDDVERGAAAIADPGVQIELGNGRGRVSAFVPTDRSHGVRIECTAFERMEDVDAVRGYLGD
jgi:methylmalonyl-CoA/ethylmalonyl-CoA epimerase